MNRGSLGDQELNQRLQRVLNPPKLDEPVVEKYGWRFQIQDKVIQTENNYEKEVFNGDIGTIESIDPIEHEVSIRFDNRLVNYDFGELDEVSLAYAVTIHKSQGSEFPAVVIPLATQHYVLLQRNLIYTGVTRRKKVVDPFRFVLIAVSQATTARPSRKCTACSWCSHRARQPNFARGLRQRPHRRRDQQHLGQAVGQHLLGPGAPRLLQCEA